MFKEKPKLLSVLLEVKSQTENLHTISLFDKIDVTLFEREGSPLFLGPYKTDEGIGDDVILTEYDFPSFHKTVIDSIDVFSILIPK